MTVRAAPIGPLDAAALWPQLGRLSCELVSAQPGSFRLRAAVESFGLGRLPSVPTAVVVGVRSGLRYRGVLAARPHGRGHSWELVSLRLTDAADDQTALALLDSCVREVIARKGHILTCRIDDGCPGDATIRRAGLMPYTGERLMRIPGRPGDGLGARLRPAAAADDQGIFRFYCATVPENIRRHEAVTADDFAALRDGYGFEREHVAERPDGSLNLWLGMGPTESRVLASDDDARQAALAVIERQAPGTCLVVPDYDVALEAAAVARGYDGTGHRLVAVRRLAPLTFLKEVVSVPAGSFPVPH